MSAIGQAVQKAVFAALDAALSVPVYAAGGVPDGAAMPYVVIDGQQADTADRLDKRKDGVSVFLTAWTNRDGAMQALQITDAIHAALHRRSLALEAGRMVDALVVRRWTEPDLAQEIVKGMATVRCRIEH